MNSQSNSIILCPQCGNACIKIETSLTHEHSIECRVCGYQEIKTITSTEKFKGYGSLVVNDTAVLFHYPISFNKEKEILKGISGNPNANFIKWSDEHGLTVLKGELPQEILPDEQEEYLKQLAQEEEYMKSVYCNSSSDWENCVPFEKF